MLSNPHLIVDFSTDQLAVIVRQVKLAHTIPCPMQGRIQELKGGGAEVKYVHARKFHAHFGILRGMPNWEGES